MSDAEIRKMVLRYVLDELTDEDKKIIQEMEEDLDYLRTTESLNFFSTFNYYIEEYTPKQHFEKESDNNA